MKPIIDPISPDTILDELTADTFVRNTNNGGNEIYIVNAHNAPETMKEIGRLREISFRDSGGGTGLDCDIDEYDTCNDNYFEQLIVWNPDDKAIVGGYRFLFCDKLASLSNEEITTPTAELFDYSDNFINNYLAQVIELGRSFVQPNYQPSKNRAKGIYSLDNLWDGLGSLIHRYPTARYYFGKVTMYPHMNREARDMILYFVNKYFPDTEQLVTPKAELNLPILTDEKTLKELFIGESYRDDYMILNKNVRERNNAIPPLVNAYMGLSSSMRNFGTALNKHFGEVEETGILIDINDIYPEKRERHMVYDRDQKPQHLK